MIVNLVHRVTNVYHYREMFFVDGVHPLNGKIDDDDYSSSLKRAGLTIKNTPGVTGESAGVRSFNCSLTHLM